MKIKLNIQKNGENLIKDALLRESESKPKKAYFFMGNIKESGFDILEECLIDLKAKKLIVIGIDKKNTTKKMLETLFSYTKSIYVFNNNELVEFDSNIVLFEYETKANIYIMNSNVSDGSFVDDIATYTVIEYDFENKEDAESYKEYVDNLVSISKLESAKKLDKEYIKELFESKQIFTTKQYTHSVMTIAELLGEKEENSKSKDVTLDNDIEVIGEEKQLDTKIPTIDLSEIEDFTIDIDIDESVKREENITEKINVTKSSTDVKKEEKKETVITEKLEDEEIVDDDIELDEVLDIESILFEKAEIELDTKSIDKKISKSKEAKEEKAEVKKVDLTKVSNLIMELPKKPTKGKDVACIKIPNYIKDMIPDFFGTMVKAKSVEKVDGVYRESKINLEIVDILSNDKFNDNKAQLVSKVGQTYIMFSSDEFKDLNYAEGDIVRIIKLSDDTYHMEFVSQDVQEYKIWKKLCTKNFKSSTRSYGVM